jgi:iron complex outermembrane receptor protein
VLWSCIPLKGEPVVELAPFRVEAWHFDELGMDLPASVLRLERVEIENSGSGSVPELLQRLAGIRFREFTGTGAEGQLAMRGFGDNSGLRVLVLVDGQVYNPPDMGGINWLGLDMGELETAEVLRGGQTVLYGNHAVAGVVKLRTRVPGGEPEGRVTAGWGTDAAVKAGAAVAQTVRGIGLRAGANWTESDGYRDNSSNEAGSAYLSWRMGESEGGEWSGRFSLSQSKLQFPGPLTYEQYREDPRQSINGGKDRSQSDDWQITLVGEGETAGSKWQLNGGLLERMRQSDFEGIHADNRQKQATMAPRLRTELAKGFFMAGADLAWDGVDYRDFLEPERVINRSQADIERQTLGAYVFSSLDFGERWNLSGGVRLETARTDNSYIRYKEEQLRPVIETNRGTVANPAYRDPPEADPDESYAGKVNKSGWAAELSLLRKVSDQVHLWGGWDRVYRYPSLDEAAAYQGFPLSDPLNEDLDPETGHNFELGMKRFASNWQFSAALFLLLLDDEISYDEGERLNLNIGDTERKGIELDMGYRKDRYGFNIHASVIDAAFRNDADGKELPLVPSVEASTVVWYQAATTLRLQASARYLSSQVQGNDFENEYRRIPAYGLIDVSFNWQPSEGVVFTGGVNNLLDKHHVVTAYSGGFYPGAGHQVFIRMKLVF